MPVIIDGTAGITSPAESVSGNLTFTGTGNRITGDFSNGTVANAVLFQTSTTNGQTRLRLIPNGTQTDSALDIYTNSSDQANSGLFSMRAGAADMALLSNRTGTGTYLPMTFTTGGSERVRVDTSGNLLVGSTTQPNAGKFAVSFTQASNQGICLQNTSASNSASYVLMINSAGGIAGTIAQTGATTVNYGSGSDYRLKNNVLPMVGALEKVAQLKPCTYNWIADDSVGQGFIAHELQAVVPDCVVGEKDAVNEDGSIKMQMVDTSFLVATLTAAIQELKAIVDTQAARITALEAA